jgi:signal transduction histidine kinase
MSAGGESSHEFRIITKSGETRWIAEKLLEQALVSTQKLESLGLLAGGIAHDFNNLLMVILGNTEIALDGAEPSQAES